MYYVNNFSLDIREYDSVHDMYPDLQDVDCVNAAYRNVFGETANPDICALPPVPTPMELAKDVCAQNILYNSSAIRGMSKGNRLSMLLRFKDELRLFLPWQHTLECKVQECLISSYRSRKYGHFGNPGEDDPLRSVNPGVGGSVKCASLIGTAGSGKSSAIGMLLDRYPKVIMHKLSSGLEYRQILFLTATAYSGHDIKTILLHFAGEIDRLNGYEMVYEAQMAKLTNIPAMTTYLKKLISTFHIGMLIIDEVQETLKAKNSFFSTLLNITAEAGVSLLLCGTEESIIKLNEREWSSRRFAQLGRIETDFFVSDKIIVETIIRQLWPYQCTLEHQSLTQGTMDALVQASGGNIDFLTTIFITAQNMIIDSEGTDRVLHLDASLVKKAASRYPNAIDLIRNGQTAINTYTDEREYAIAKMKNRAEAALKEEALSASLLAPEFAGATATALSFIINALRTISITDERRIQKEYRSLSNDPEFGKLDYSNQANMIAARIMKADDAGESGQKRKQKKKEETAEQKKAFSKKLEESMENAKDGAVIL